MSSPRRSSGLWQAQNQHQQGPPSRTSSFLELGPQHGWQMMSTRGQNLPGLLRSYSISEDINKPESANDLENGSYGSENTGSVRHLTASPTSEIPRRRGSILIGDTSPAVRWYSPLCISSAGLTCTDLSLGLIIIRPRRSCLNFGNQCK